MGATTPPRRRCWRSAWRCSAGSATSGRPLTLNMLALARREQGDHAGARALLEESLALSRAAGDRAGMGGAVGRLGEVAHALGDYPRARALYQQAWRLAREDGHPKQLPWPPHDLGCLALDEAVSRGPGATGGGLTLRRGMRTRWGRCIR